jgi:hypothetical protein
MSRLEWIAVLLVTAVGVALAMPNWPRTMAARFLNGECWVSRGRWVTCVEPPRPSLPPPGRTTDT